MHICKERQEGPSENCLVKHLFQCWGKLQIKLRCNMYQPVANLTGYESIYLKIS